MYLTTSLYLPNLILLEWSYFIGSIFFGVGTWVWLYIWKQEQWRFYHPLDTDTYVSVYQQLYITLVIISLSKNSSFLFKIFSVHWGCSLCVLVFYAARAEPFDHFYCMIAFYGILLHLGLLQLTNALAQIPQDKGWGNVTALYTLEAVFQTWWWFAEYLFVNIYFENQRSHKKTLPSKKFEIRETWH